MSGCNDHSCPARWRKLASPALIWAALTLAACGAANENLVPLDKEQDPARLARVVSGEEQSEGFETRTEAGLMLIRMHKQRGRTIGIDVLMRTLRAIDEGTRAKLMAAMLPGVMRALRGPPAAEGREASDPSYAFKDAAYLLLVDDTELGAPLLADEGLRGQLRAALSDWVHASFGPRLEARGQLFGPGRLFQQLGDKEVAKLLELIVPSGKHVRVVSAIIGEHGDDETRATASKKLVTVARYVGSKEWLDGHDAKDDEDKRRAQDEAVKSVFAAMRDVGGEAATTFCMEVASNEEGYKVWRQAALAALRGRIDSGEQIDMLFKIVDSGAPPLVVDQALRRIGELPRGKVADKLVTLFETSDWRLRRVVAATFLKLSTVKHIDVFLEELGRRATRNFNLAEAITYGAHIGDLEGGDVRAALGKHIDGDAVRARLSAIAYYYSHGSYDDLATLEPLKTDRQRVPKCSGPGCDWSCVVDQRSKTVTTVGDFVRYCVEPALVRAKLTAQAPPPDPSGGNTSGGDKPATDPATSPTAKDNASAIASMSGALRKCYDDGKKNNSELAGKTTLYVTIVADGKVFSVMGGKGSPLEPILPCMKKVVNETTFAKPSSGKGMVAVPVEFPGE